jgi:hypothetical protein
MRVPIRVALVLLCIALVGRVVWSADQRPHADPRVGSAPLSGAPVIVELFSSEGCSSCPPADTWLASLDQAGSIGGVPLITLEEHVDYWDRLGWKDPFGQAQFGERQQAYASVLADDRVYTPEIVIDGRAAVPAGDDIRGGREARAAASEPRATVRLTRVGQRVTIDVSDIPSEAARQGSPIATDDAFEVWLAVTERGITSDVQRGENAGRRLAHAPIVRVLRRIGIAQASSFRAETPIETNPAWAPGALRIVAFVQRARTKHIVGASAI